MKTKLKGRQGLVTSISELRKLADSLLIEMVQTNVYDVLDRGKKDWIENKSILINIVNNERLKDENGKERLASDGWRLEKKGDVYVRRKARKKGNR